MQTIQQRRAQYALQKVEAAAKSSGVNPKEFKSYAAAFPAMIQMNGLGQAAAFYLSQGGMHKELYELLSKWLTDDGQPYQGAENLLDEVIKRDMPTYRLAQAEALALLDWVKKFAKAYMVARSGGASPSRPPGRGEEVRQGVHGGEAMTAPLYAGHAMPSEPGRGHKGLWFDRFFDQYDAGWSAASAPAKQAWIKKVEGPCGEPDLLKAAAGSMQGICGVLGGACQQYQTTWHFATGLGNPHPVENGFAWHPTLGVPYLTGAAVKGLVRAWVESWMDLPIDADRRRTLRRWFGSEDKNPQKRLDLRKAGLDLTNKGERPDTEAGDFMFFDAIPVAPVTLACDVMTPHYGDWYEKGGEIKNAANEPEKIPADWHDPVPVPFLVVKQATFLFSVAPRKRAGKPDEQAALAAELPRVMQALTDALQYLGAGAKTAVGYGLFAAVDLSKAAEPSSAARAKPRYKGGDKVRVQRIEDPKGKGRTWFVADDGFGGVVPRGQVPQVAIGDGTELWIASVSEGYNFSAEPIAQSGKERASRPQGRKRQ